MTVETIDISKALPHRHPFVHVDRIVEIDYMKRAKGYKNVSFNEGWASGHFPDEPLYPGVLIIETMAQVGGFLFYDAERPDQGNKFYLSNVNGIKFAHPVVPGDTLFVEAELAETIFHFHQIKCTAKVGDRVVASGMLTLAKPSWTTKEDG